MQRAHRTTLERLVYRKVLQCGKCGRRAHQWRVPFESDLVFAFSRHTRCIQCGSLRVRRLPRRDHIDRMSSHPMSVLAGLARAPIYHCGPCRLQYHDWRTANPSVSRAERAAAAE
jgi:hypothetical protein